MMPRFQARHIDDLEPGSTVEINGREYLRIEDQDALHIAGWVVDLKTGWAGAWYRLIDRNEMVSSTACWSCPACSEQGVVHCAIPDECGSMKLRKAAA